MRSAPVFGRHALPTGLDRISGNQCPPLDAGSDTSLKSLIIFNGSSIMNTGLIGLLHRVMDCVEMCTGKSRPRTDRLASTVRFDRRVKRQQRWLRLCPAECDKVCCVRPACGA
jgi:hypothetical protein